MYSFTLLIITICIDSSALFKVYKGPDGLVRVVDLKTGSTELKRPVHKLVPLNTLNNEEESM